MRSTDARIAQGEATAKIDEDAHHRSIRTHAHAQVVQLDVRMDIASAVHVHHSDNRVVRQERTIIDR